MTDPALLRVWEFRSGSTERNGCRIDRVLRVSTQHMPDLEQDLTPWHWGVWQPDSMSISKGRHWEMAWIFAYEEDPGLPDGPIPQWLLDLCVKARNEYGCNWILLDPEGDIVQGLPTYQHP